MRLSALYPLGDSGALRLTYEYDDLHITGDSFQPDQDSLGFIRAMDPSADIGLDTDKYAVTSYSRGGDADDEQKSQRVVGLYEQGIGDHTLTFLSGWSEYDNDRLTDTDFLFDVGFFQRL